jgi:hypothetical protein
LGLTAKSVAGETGIPYATIVLWRFKRRKVGAFQEVRVVAALETPRPALGISKSCSVTLPNLEMPSKRAVHQGLNLRTPSGFVIENLDEGSVLKLIATLSAGGC